MEQHMGSRRESANPGAPGAAPPSSDVETTHPARSRRGVEMVVFIVVSIVGTWALGTGTRGLLEPGHLGDLVWFAVLGGALMVIFGQMGRVHDSWPRSGEPSRWRRVLGRRFRRHVPRDDRS